MVKKVGEHVTLDIIGTKKEYEPSFFENLVQKIADKAKVTVLNVTKYKFEPQGFTLVALLAESHMSFHTYPEKGIISFDFYTCGIISPAVALDVIKKEIEHKRIIKKELITSFFSCELNLPCNNPTFLLKKTSSDKCLNVFFAELKFIFSESSISGKIT